MVQTAYSSIKLILSLNQMAIYFAKEYAKKVGKSVSALTEDYFNSLKIAGGSDKNGSFDSAAFIAPTPIVSEIAGILGGHSLTEAENYKGAYPDYLAQKYGR